MEKHTFLDNLNGLHGEEERLRQQSLTAMQASSGLMDHLQVIEGAMNLVQMLGRGFSHPTPDQQVVQLIGIRLFNGAATSLKLAMAGYYQLAFHLIRDLLETTHLLDYFLLEPASIAIWQAGGKAAKKTFHPETVRKALDKRDGWTTGQRGTIYQRYSEYASHPTYSGIQLVAPKPAKLATYGPFFDEDTLGHFLVDLAKYMTHGVLIFGRHFETSDAPFATARGQFHVLADQWCNKHLRA